VPNLQSALPELVAEYQQARAVVDAGRGGKALLDQKRER
jgi:hypothetical protein